jgi:hypothetical protein
MEELKRIASKCNFEDIENARKIKLAYERLRRGPNIDDSRCPYGVRINKLNPKGSYDERRLECPGCEYAIEEGVDVVTNECLWSMSRDSARQLL